MFQMIIPLIFSSQLFLQSFAIVKTETVEILNVLKLSYISDAMLSHHEHQMEYWKEGCPLADIHGSYVMDFVRSVAGESDLWFGSECIDSDYDRSDGPFVIIALLQDQRVEKQVN